MGGLRNCMSDFPNSIFTPRTSENLPGVVYDPLKSTEVFAEDYSLPAAEIVAIETTLGTTPQGAYVTVKAWLTALAAVCADFVSSASIDPGHLHSKLVASDGAPDPALAVNAAGKVGIGMTVPYSDELTVRGATGLVAADSGYFRHTTGGGKNYIESGLERTAGSAADLIFSDMFAVTPWLTILAASGNVGIGISTPAERLTVEGNLKISNGYYLIFRNSNIQIHSHNANELTLESIGTNGAIKFEATDYSAFFDNAGNERVRILASGNVGIGTPTPSAQLHCLSATGASIKLEKTGTNAGIAQIYNDGNFVMVGRGSSPNRRVVFYDQMLSGAGNTVTTPAFANFNDLNTGIYFPDNTDKIAIVTGGVERLRVDDAGKVGIGTTVPGAMLQVEKVAGADAVGGAVIIGRNDSTNWRAGAVFPYYYNANVAGDKDTLSFAVSASTTSPATVGKVKMVITDSGKVGIGTTSPTALLDVNSDVVRLRTAKTPASAGAAGNAGDICWDASYIYVCVATNTWMRSALVTW